MIVDDLELERRLRMTLDHVVPVLADEAMRAHGAPFELVDDARGGRRWRVATVSVVAVGLIVLTVTGLVASSSTDRSPLPPVETQSVAPEPTATPSPSTTAVDTTTLTTTVTSTAETAAPSSTASGHDLDGLGEVDAADAAELGVGAAEQWARQYLAALAGGDYDTAAALSPTGSGIVRSDGPRGPVTYVDTLTESTASSGDASLADQLRDFCEGGDGVCLPALDLVPQWEMVVDGCPQDADPATCYEQRPGLYVDAVDRFPDWWVVRFTLDDDGVPARFHPTSARPYTVHLEVTVEDGHVAVRGLPPVRSAGDPDERLPQIELVDTGGEWRTVELDVPGTEHTTIVWTDGTDLCAGGCTAFPYPLGGAVGSGTAGSVDGIEWLHEITVASGVDVSITDARTGEPLEPLLRSDVPDIGNMTVWVFRSTSPPDSPNRQPPLRVTYTLADGASFVG